ncbi:preprotein translocase subunit SecA [Ruminococcus sp. YE71]|uniref:preprotein translocase subunit SecA n=1 Tax=unclassified Ruminococcus TaxID=2608920 RepID=UPI000889B10C|nr:MULTISPECIES: preprotein translocase subunit SecA [unclassified Ruminococcus]SDA20275.1 preprotein translocase subunit SecA [Ruminococcus sp. YE78]SFW32171.1 preprotein translocase subunit SecA [Ruminococcus sp. YE71]
MGLMDALFGNYSKKELKRIEPIKDKVLELESKYQKMSDHELRDQTRILKEKLADGVTTLDDTLPDALAVCREGAWRVLGKKAYPVQIIGAIVLHQGRIAEMRTGEGKTLVACLAAYSNALNGKGVHVVTVNDYLAKFQSEEMGKVFRFLGLTIGCVLQGMSKEEKHIAYNADITYGTNNEFGFDYLRDNREVEKSAQVQRPHAFAIVDEVDSILIDEARTPLIISGQGEESSELYQAADRFAKTLKPVTVVEMDDKADNDLLDGDYIIDEKAKTATLTKSGVKKAEKAFGVINLMDADNLTLLHHINQAIKANGTMKRDTDYVVKDGEVLIVDEFTGRIMVGRRYNDGLHQAIEAKEGVKVARESKTIATITFQNYFRLYKKLSGMTGTALTEEDEFREIYKLDVIEIPTNKPIARKDHSDVIYKTEKAKYNAVIEQIIECNKKGQPVLVGTVSVEKSEYLSRLLKNKGVKHQVLNAKYHEKEAKIVAQAGKYGAVTIATNMAGRGTDILLGGNSEYLATEELRKLDIPEEIIVEATGFSETDDQEILDARKKYREFKDKFDKEVADKADKVREAGGLYIIGTERHESRRIDNQLRGRAGRQGDPGESQFFLSLEDDLMRLFGGDKVTSMMDTLKVDEDMPIQSRMLTGIIESSQKKLEGRNFNIRKNVLNYDDVMNTQREIIYGQRQQVLDGEDIHESIVNMINQFVEGSVNMYLLDDEIHDDWNLEGLKEHLMNLITTESDFNYTPEELEAVSKADIIKQLQERADKIYEKREQELGTERLREVERYVLLKIVDQKWMDHIDDMDQLKRGITLRSYGQKNPVVEYRMEGFEMFDAMVDSIREDTVRMLFTIQIRQQVPKRQVAGSETTSNKGYTARHRRKKIGPNDPCPCGSGKKYKKCCGASAANANSAGDDSDD